MVRFRRKREILNRDYDMYVHLRYEIEIFVFISSNLLAGTVMNWQQKMWAIENRTFCMIFQKLLYSEHWPYLL